MVLGPLKKKTEARAEIKADAIAVRRTARLMHRRSEPSRRIAGRRLPLSLQRRSVGDQQTTSIPI
jgi:hypothetical protein